MRGAQFSHAVALVREEVEGGWRVLHRVYIKVEALFEMAEALARRALCKVPLDGAAQLPVEEAMEYCRRRL